MVSRSRWVFTGLVALLALQRIYELHLSARHEKVIRARGGREHAAWQLRAMKVLHTGWFAAMLVEVHGLQRPFRPGLSRLALVTLIAGQSLRYAAIRSLDWRWTVNVMTLPGLPPVQKGPYRYLRHPNYLGVSLEIVAVPLLHSAYLTASLFSIANLLLLRTRIRAEDRALLEVVDGQPVQRADKISYNLEHGNTICFPGSSHPYA
jgi:methyltransferase